VIRQKREGQEFKDIYSVPRVRQQPTDYKRKSVFVVESSQTVSTESLGVEETSSNLNVSPAVSGCMGVEKTSSNSNPTTAVSGSRDDATITQESHEENASEEGGEQAVGPEGEERTRTKQDRAKECRLEWLFYIARRDPAMARDKALNHIQCNKAEHADKICYVFDEEGRKSPFIRLPCMVPHINPDTGKIMQMYELPFLYVVEGDHGRHLHIGQSFRTGMAFTRYDGKLVPSDEVEDPTWARSLHYRGHVVDGRGYGDHLQMENNSLGHIANHAYDGSIAKYQQRLCRAPVSKYPESIFLTARRDGEPFTEVTANKTSGSAARDHKIQKIPVFAGQTYIDANHLDRLSPQIQAALQLLRTQCGYDLNRVCGQGSYGVVVDVSHKNERFAVKLGTCAYRDHSSRRSVSVEAALLNFGERIQREARNSGADAIGPFAPRLRLWDGCPAVLISEYGTAEVRCSGNGTG
jgi:hypothetical protein